MKRNRFTLSFVLAAVVLILLPNFSFGQGTSVQGEKKPVSAAAQKRAEAKRKLAEIQKRREEYAKRGRFPYAQPGQARLFPEVMKTQGPHSEINEITVAELVNGGYGENAQLRFRLALALSADFPWQGKEPRPSDLPEEVWQEFKRNILNNRYTRARFSGRDFDLRMVYGIPDTKGNLTVKATSYPPEMIGFTIVGLKVEGILVNSGPHVGKLIHFVVVTAFQFPDRTEVEVGCGNITGVLSIPVAPEPVPAFPPAAKPAPEPPLPVPQTVTVVVNKQWNNHRGEALRELPGKFGKVRFAVTGSDGTGYEDMPLDDTGLKLTFEAQPNTRVEVVERPESQVRGFRDKTRKLVIDIPALTEQVLIVRQPYVNQKERGCHIGPLPCWAAAVIGVGAGVGTYLILRDRPDEKIPEPPEQPQKKGGPGPSPITWSSTASVSVGSGGITIRF